ncbi:hypothetical protein ACQPW1_22780 [Nocardia sp. CA-128927]|uniref:hypothetical protein n=1 Tax=Nocardia sp. CA-128927 TaxID=3239975 RepID=UPI003D9629CF
MNAGIGGAGGGAALISIAQHLGVNTWPGLILMYCAPAIAVGYGGVIAQIQLWGDWTRERSVIRQARKTIEKGLKDPHTSDEHKADLTAKLELLDKAVAENHLDRVIALR